MTADAMRPETRRRALPALLARVALACVAWVVPMRDRSVPPSVAAAANAPKFSRSARGEPAGGYRLTHAGDARVTLAVAGVLGPAGCATTGVGGQLSWLLAACPIAFAVGGVWGTSDAAFVFFFGLAVCLLCRAFWYLPLVVGAALRLARRDTPGPAR